jgi:hypothetical protein
LGSNTARSIRQQTEAPFFPKRRGRGGIGGRPGRLKTALTDGRADFKFDELNAKEVRNATIKLSSSTSGTLIDIFGAQKIPTLTLSITGPLEAPNLNGRLDGGALTTGAIRWSALPGVTIGPAKYDGNTIDLPVDIDVAGPSGELSLYGSNRILLRGSVERVRLTGRLTLGRNLAQLKILPGGLTVQLSGAVSTEPWIVGGRPQFGEGRLTISSSTGLEISEASSIGYVDLDASALLVTDPKIRLAAMPGAASVWAVSGQSRESSVET